MTKRMEKGERDLIEETQALLGNIKRDLNRVANKMAALGKINREAGRAEAANASMRLEGEARRALGQITIAHADASDSMVREWPEDGGVVIFGGGGGR